MGKHGKYWSLVGAFSLLAMSWASAAISECRQALSIGLDISGSVDTKEYRLQMDGLAGALLQRDVMNAFLAIPSAPVRLHIYEWSGVNTQRVVVDWADIETAQDLQQIAGVLRQTERGPREIETAIGNSMIYGINALSQQNGCWRRTLDLSGDGESNKGPRPRKIARSMAGQTTINGIVIGQTASPRGNSALAKLKVYFQSEVIRGPDAFVETARGFADFEDAMARKLLKELQTPAVGQLEQRNQ